MISSENEECCEHSIKLCLREGQCSRNRGLHSLLGQTLPRSRHPLTGHCRAHPGGPASGSFLLPPLFEQCPSLLVSNEEILSASLHFTIALFILWSALTDGRPCTWPGLRLAPRFPHTPRFSQHWGVCAPESVTWVTGICMPCLLAGT